MECLLKISGEYRSTVEPRPINDLIIIKLDNGKVLKKCAYIYTLLLMLPP